MRIAWSVKLDFRLGASEKMFACCQLIYVATNPPRFAVAAVAQESFELQLAR